MISDRTRTNVIIVVTGVWLANFIAGLVPSIGYEPDQAINGIFMGIVGGLFALGARDKASRSSESESESPKKHLDKPDPGGEE